MEIFGREVYVTVQPTELDGAQLVPVGDATVLNDFDIDFLIVKAHEEHANKCHVSVYNVPEDLRIAWQKSRAQVSVSAGYASGGAVATRQIAVFDITRAPSVLVGADWVTKFEGGEAHTAIAEAKVNQSFSAGIPFATFMRAIILPITQLGVGQGNFDQTIGQLSATMPNGAHAEGRAMHVLKRWCRTTPYKSVSIQNGALRFAIPGQGDKLLITNLGPDTGLIGLPEYGEADPKKGKPAQMKLHALLQPQIIPGSIVNLTIPPNYGNFGQVNVNKVEHKGNNGYSQAFNTTMEANA